MRALKFTISAILITIAGSALALPKVHVATLGTSISCDLSKDICIYLNTQIPGKQYAITQTITAEDSSGGQSILPNIESDYDSSAASNYLWMSLEPNPNKTITSLTSNITSFKVDNENVSLDSSCNKIALPTTIGKVMTITLSGDKTKATCTSQ
jgi:hypothetical protein